MENFIQIIGDLGVIGLIISFLFLFSCFLFDTNPFQGRRVYLTIFLAGPFIWIGFLIYHFWVWLGKENSKE